MVFRLFFFRQRYNFLTCKVNKILKRNLSNVLTEPDSSNYKYLLILDLEATCDIKVNKEVIEFPCIKVNITNFLEESRFHEYVRPVFQPTLTNFCVDLTGILQEMVNEAKTFSEVYKMFEDWRAQENLTEENSLYVTSGDWDLGHMIPEQCALSNIEVPSHMKVWADIKKIFGYNSESFYSNFSDVMKHYNLKFLGRPHSGIDDCLNILQVVKVMGSSGIKFQPTCKLTDHKVEVIHSKFKGKVNNMSGSSVIKSKHFKRR